MRGNGFVCSHASIRPLHARNRAHPVAVRELVAASARRRGLRPRLRRSRVPPSFPIALATPPRRCRAPAPSKRRLRDRALLRATDRTSGALTQSTINYAHFIRTGNADLGETPIGPRIGSPNRFGAPRRIMNAPNSRVPSSRSRMDCGCERAVARSPRKPASRWPRASTRGADPTPKRAPR